MGHVASSQNARGLNFLAVRLVRITPVKTEGTWRRVDVMLCCWAIDRWMRTLHRELDLWLPKSIAPERGSPWEQSRLHRHAELPIGSATVIDVVVAEAHLRHDAIPNTSRCSVRPYEPAAPIRSRRWPARPSRPARSPRRYLTQKPSQQSGRCEV